VGSWAFDCVSNAWTHRSARHDELFGYEHLQDRWDWSIALEHVQPEGRSIVVEAFAQAMHTRRLL
jgi:hypothetical protein